MILQTMKMLAASALVAALAVGTAATALADTTPGGPQAGPAAKATPKPTPKASHSATPKPSHSPKPDSRS